MSWEDDAIEYAKWNSPSLAEAAMYDINDEPKVLYCRIHYKTLRLETDKWNNQKWVVDITPIEVSRTEGIDDELTERSEVLSMGVRLFNTVKKAYKSKWNYVRLFRLGTKFNTQYFVKEHKLAKQTKVAAPKKKKK